MIKLINILNEIKLIGKVTPEILRELYKDISNKLHEIDPHAENILKVFLNLKNRYTDSKNYWIGLENSLTTSAKGLRNWKQQHLNEFYKILLDFKTKNKL